MKRRSRLLILLAILGVLFLVSFVVLTVFVGPRIVTTAMRSKLRLYLGVEPEIGSARFSPLGGLLIRDLSFECPVGDARVRLRAPLVEIYPVTRSILTGHPAPRRIVLVDPVVELTISELELSSPPLHEISGIDFEELGEDLRDGLLKIARLDPFLPDLEIENASFALREDGPAARTLALEGINLSIVRSDQGVLDVQVEFADGDLGELRLAGSWDLPRARARFDLSNKNLVLSPTLFERLPEAIAKKGLDGRISGRVQAKLGVSLDAAAASDEGVLALAGTAQVDAFRAVPLDFPYPVNDIAVDLELAGGLLTIRRLAGKIDSELHPCPIEAAGVVYLDRPRLDFALDVILENFHVDSRVLPLLRDFQRPMWSVADPRGFLRLQAHVVPSPDPAVDPRPFYSGLMTVKDVSFHIKPRRAGEETDSSGRAELIMPHLSGTINASSSALEDAVLVGGEGPRRFDIRGSVYDINVRDSLHYDIKISTEHLDLQSDVRALLTRKKTIEAWNKWLPEGLVNVVLRYYKPKDGDRRIDLVAEVIKARIARTPIEVPIEGLTGGTLYLKSGLMKVESFTSDSPAGRFTLSATVRDGAVEEIRFRGADLLIDDSVRRAAVALDEKARKGEIALPEKLSSLAVLWESLNPRGRIDLDLDFLNPPGADAPVVRALLNIKEAALYIRPLSLPLSDIVSGRIEYKDNTLYVRDVAAYEADTAFTLNGELRNLVPGDLARAEGSVTLAAERLTLDDLGKLLENVSGPPREKEDLAFDLGRLCKIWRELSPEGEIDALVTVSKSPGEDPLQTIDVCADVKIRNAGAMLLGKLPVSNLAGAVYLAGRLPRTIEVTSADGKTRRIEVPARSARIVDFSGARADATFQLNGVVSLADAVPSFELDAKAVNVSVDAELLGLVQDPRILETLKKVNPVGRVSFELRAIGALSDAGPEVRLSGEITLDDVSATMGMNFRDVSATVFLARAEFADGTLDASGAITAERLAVKRQVVRDLSLDFLVRRRPQDPATREIVVTGISGSFHRGAVTGEAKIDLAPGSVRYGLDLRISDVDMTSFIRSAFDYDRYDYQGVLNGQILLQGEGVAPDKLVAEGTLELTGARLWEQPLPLKVFELLSLSKPDQYAFTSASIAFEFARRDVFLKDLRFTGKGLSVYGRGWIRQGKLLDLAFISGSGAETLTPSIVEPLKQQLAHVRVKGSLDDFETRIDLIAPVSAPLADLLDMILKRD